MQTFDKPWLGFLAVPVMAFGGIVAVFVVGIILAGLVIAWPVSCRVCGRLRLGDLRAGTRARLIAKKIFVALLLALIVLAGHAALSAWRAIKTQ